MAEETAAVRLHISGRVQGVGFRAWCVATGRKLGLLGWVRNLTDGSVEAFAQGPRVNVERLVTAAHAGPPGARVMEVQSTAVALAPDLDGFHQLPTAQSGTAP